MAEEKHQEEQQTQSQSPRSESCANVFNSVDFGRFLSKQFPKTSAEGTNPFLSKDNPLPSFEVSSLFKSKDAFSKMFSSADWEMKFESKEDTKSPAPLPTPLPTPAPVASTNPSKSETLKSILSSREWLPMNTLGNHVDISINKEMFGNSDSEHTSSQPEAPQQVKTDWDNMFFSQMQLVPPQPSPSASLSSQATPEPLPEQEVVPASQVPVPPASIQAAAAQAPRLDVAAVSSQTPKKKRKRKPRKKIVPEKKVYVEPKDMDVLLGRGGRSNHHPGNKRYREEVKNLQSWYLGIEDKDEKTDLSQCLVDYVHSYNGRFLEKDANGWYEVPNIVSRRKASQALREDTDPAKRAAKRARFLAKRAKAEQQKQLQEQQSLPGSMTAV